MFGCHLFLIFLLITRLYCSLHSLFKNFFLFTYPSIHFLSTGECAQDLHSVWMNTLPLSNISSHIYFSLLRKGLANMLPLNSLCNPDKPETFNPPASTSPSASVAGVGHHTHLGIWLSRILLTRSNTVYCIAYHFPIVLKFYPFMLRSQIYSVQQLWFIEPF